MQSLIGSGPPWLAGLCSGELVPSWAISKKAQRRHQDGGFWGHFGAKADRRRRRLIVSSTLLMRCSPLLLLSGGLAGEARWLNRRASFLVCSLQIGSLACPPVMS
ncbi:hypothetical protein CEP53_013848 [Fusarium sp. AF-6]|nr:hypothetical protein CEP53_013848 [Fusarium sp. AF-6]